MWYECGGKRAASALPCTAAHVAFFGVTASGFFSVLAASRSAPAIPWHSRIRAWPNPCRSIVDVERFRGVAVDGEQRHASARFVMNAGDVEIGHVVGDVGIVAGPSDDEPQRRAAAEIRGEVIGIVNRLPPSGAARLGHDRRDHVHELRDAGDLHDVRAADEGVEDAADLQHVLEIVDVLKQPRRVRPAAVAAEDRAVLPCWNGTRRSIRRRKS